MALTKMPGPNTDELNQIFFVLILSLMQALSPLQVLYCNAWQTKKEKIRVHMNVVPRSTKNTNGETEN